MRRLSAGELHGQREPLLGKIKDEQRVWNVKTISRMPAIDIKIRGLSN
jgi:hypothetical protein